MNVSNPSVKRSEDHDKEIDSIKKTLEVNKVELDLVNINITKLEEEQLRIIEKCTNVKMKEADLNECITNNDVHMSKQYHECNNCSESFESSYSLERHIISVHKKEKSYKCDLCETSFLFNWKFKKHMRIHQVKTKRKSHYYNNDKKCPFEQDGCKFAHEVSEQCKFIEKCKKTKCQYRH